MKKIPKKIIIRMPNWLGDCVMALPVIADLHQKWPDASIDVLAQGSVADLLKNDPSIRTIFSFKRAERSSVIPFLQKEKYDLGLLLTNSFSSAWQLWRGKVKNIIGFKGEWRSIFLTQSIPAPKAHSKKHLVLTYKALLAPLDIPPSATAPKIFLTEEEKNEALHILDSLGVPRNARLIGINPGAAYGSAKCWLPDRFQKVTQNLIENPATWVIFFGDKAGAPLVNEICTPFPKKVLNMAGKTNLRQLIALINSCSLILTNDSGPMHIAAALQRPLIALFGSTNEIATGPFEWGNVIHKHVECSPCYKRTCPIDFRCMTRITVNEVLEAIGGRDKPKK